MKSYIGKPRKQPLSLAFRFVAWTAIWLTHAVFAVSAAEFQSLESIRSAAEQHVLELLNNPGNEMSASAGSLDQRLRLSDCTQPLETFSPPGRSSGARRTVGVRCTDESPWSLYVPVTLSIDKRVAVASGVLSRGHILTKDDILFDQRDVAGLHHSYFTETDQIIGQKLKRTIKSGDILSARQLAAPQAVKRGETVVIVAKSDTIQIHMSGKAKENGAVGERITVTNSSSGKEVEATVIEPGIVTVAF
jgi:flagella basal body P-ring formation protein FlgA